jgi:hypothetical protein
MGDDLFSETKMHRVELQFLCVEAHIVMIAAIEWGMIFTLCSKIQVHKVELQFFHLGRHHHDCSNSVGMMFTLCSETQVHNVELQFFH